MVSTNAISSNESFLKIENCRIPHILGRYECFFNVVNMFLSFNFFSNNVFLLYESF